ncbi:hypothetical protein [Vibrio cortegadensis]|uniref:Uncharacterized protein n=2 Tax=Vibrio TaxID=662 RepID=A0ABV4MC41_9VIBR|nr:putative plasmid protein [Vibrio genomosp. F6]
MTVSMQTESSTNPQSATSVSPLEPSGSSKNDISLSCETLTPRAKRNLRIVDRLREIHGLGGPRASRIHQRPMNYVCTSTRCIERY